MKLFIFTVLFTYVLFWFADYTAVRFSERDPTPVCDAIYKSHWSIKFIFMNGMANGCIDRNIFPTEKIEG